MDVVGELPCTARGNRFILVITDHFSKFAFAVPLATVTTQSVIDALFHNVVLAGHGVPIRILTDRGTNFNSQLARELYECFNILLKLIYV